MKPPSGIIGRRAVLAGLGLTTLAPRALFAQPATRTVRLGVLLYSDPGADPNVRAIREALREHGYVEGRNLSIEYRYADGRPERLPQLAIELAQTRPDLIFALGGDVAVPATAATSTIPLVIMTSNDPVRAKLVTSLASPGANVTGVTFLSAELAPKRLQFLKEAAPRITRVAVL